ncbi:MAG: hypothetical protein ACOCWR_02905 [Oceanidesulfovibrio sp.]
MNRELRQGMLIVVLASGLLLAAGFAAAQEQLLPLCPDGAVTAENPLPNGRAQTVRCSGSVQAVYDHYRAAMQRAGYDLVVEAIEPDRGGLAGVAKAGERMSVTISAKDGGVEAVIDQTDS